MTSAKRLNGGVEMDVGQERMGGEGEADVKNKVKEV